MTNQEAYRGYLASSERIAESWVFIEATLRHLESEASLARKPDALRYLVKSYGLLLASLEKEKYIETFLPGPRPWHVLRAAGLVTVKERADAAMEKIMRARGFVHLSGPDTLPDGIEDIDDMGDLHAGRRDV